MRRKGTEALLNTLFVSDVRKYVVKYGQLRTLEGGDMEPGLSHEREKPHRLQRDGLASGVGTGHNEQVEIFAQPYVDGHDLFRIQQRMPSVFDADIAPLIEHGTGGFHLFGKHGPGKNEVQIHQQAVIIG